MKEKMREEKREDMLLLKNVSNQKNPPDEFANNVSKKIPFRRIFVRKFRFFLVFSIIYMIRTRIFGPRELIQT